MKERLSKLAPIAVPIVLFAAACKSDGSEKTPPKFEDGVNIETNLTPTAFAETQTTVPKTALIPTLEPSPEPVKPNNTNRKIEISPDGLWLQITDTSPTVVYKYELSKNPITIDALLDPLSLDFLTYRIPEADYLNFKSLLEQAREEDRKQAGSEKGASLIVGAATILSDNCIDGPDRILEAYAKDLASYHYHNHPESFESNNYLYFRECFWGNRYDVGNSQNPTPTINENVPNIP